MDTMIFRDQQPPPNVKSVTLDDIYLATANVDAELRDLINAADAFSPEKVDWAWNALWALWTTPTVQFNERMRATVRDALMML